MGVTVDGLPNRDHPANQQAPPVGVYGSVERLLMYSPVAALLPKVFDEDLRQDVANIWLYERPAQADPYPSVVIRSGRSSVIEETFEGHKTKSYPVEIEIFAESDELVARIWTEVERVLEGDSAADKIAVWVGSLRGEGDAGVAIHDEGEEFNREYKRYSPAGKRAYKCVMHYTVEVKYQPRPRA